MAKESRFGANPSDPDILSMLGDAVVGAGKGIAADITDTVGLIPDAHNAVLKKMDIDVPDEVILGGRNLRKLTGQPEYNTPEMDTGSALSMLLPGGIVKKGALAMGTLYAAQPARLAKFKELLERGATKNEALLPLSMIPGLGNAPPSFFVPDTKMALKGKAADVVDRGLGKKSVSSLGDSMIHPDLFSLSPKLSTKLKEIELVVQNVNRGQFERQSVRYGDSKVGGMFSPEENRITVFNRVFDPDDSFYKGDIRLRLADQVEDSDNRIKAKSTLLHEIQHAVQKNFSMPGGTSPEEWKRRIKYEQLTPGQLVVKRNIEQGAFKDQLDEGTITIENLMYHFTAGEIQARHVQKMWEALAKPGHVGLYGAGDPLLNRYDRTQFNPRNILFKEEYMTLDPETGKTIQVGKPPEMVE